MRYARRLNNAGVVDLLAAGFGLVFVLGMVSPTLEHSRELVQRAKCTSNLKQLGAAWAMYLDDYGSYLPFHGVREFEWGEGKGWMDKLFPYVSPGALGEGPAYPESANTKSTEVFRCPGLERAPDGRKYLCSYFLNWRLRADAGAPSFDVRRLKFPRKVVVLYDRNKWTGVPANADNTDEWGNTGTEFSDPWGPGGLWYYHSGGPDFSGPHDGGYNILFGDWHVKWFGEWDSDNMTRYSEY